MRRPLRILVLLTLLATTAPLARAAVTPELLVNPGAEALDLTGWTDPLGNGFMVLQGVAQSGEAAFFAGVNGVSGARVNELAQTVTLSEVSGSLAAAVDAGLVTSAFAAYAQSGVSGATTDDARVLLEFLDAADGVLATYDSEPARPVHEWVRCADERTLPAGTRALRVRMRGTRALSITTDALFDSLSLRLTVPDAGVPGATGANTPLRLRVLANPARGEGVFEVALAAPGALAVTVWDAAGARVRTLAAGASSAGTRTLRWDGRRADGSLAAPGVYLVRASGAGAEALARIALVR